MGQIRNNWNFAMDVVVQFMQLHRTQGIKVEKLRKVNKLAFPPMRGVKIERMDYKTEDGDEIHGEWFIPKSVECSNKAILYFHGGGFIFCSTKTHRDLICNIALHSKSKVYGINYRLAPEFKYPTQIEDGIAAYKYLRSPACNSIRPEDIIFAGDSAGGNLALCVALHLRDIGEPLPKAIALLSPWVDLTNSSSSWTKNFEHDYLPSAKEMYIFSRHYAPDHMELNDPRISPVFADLTGLPPIFVQASDLEQIYGDAIWLESKGIEQNVEVTLDLYNNLPHVFQAFKIPQAQEAFKKLGDWMRKQHERDHCTSCTSQKIFGSSIHNLSCK